jgi:hypothetical protein
MRNPFRKMPPTSWVTINDSAQAWQDALDAGYSPYVRVENTGEYMQAIEVRATPDGLAEVLFVRGIGFTDSWRHKLVRSIRRLTP